jgi:hypothetical protein
MKIILNKQEKECIKHIGLLTGLIPEDFEIIKPYKVEMIKHRLIITTDEPK